MATNTTNLNLIKPSGTDKIRITQINQNMDILDEKIGSVGNTSLQAQIAAVDSGLAIVSNGNTHVAITSGQYVYIRNHSSLSEGLYKATAAIAANVALSTSNVTKLTTGSANDLKSAIDSLNSHIEAHWFGNNTLANIQTAMVSFAQNMSDGGVRSIEFGISQATGNFGATNYIGKLERISGSRLCVTVMNAMYSTNMVIGNYKDGTWNWAEVALSSQIAKVKNFGIAQVQATLVNQVTIGAGQDGKIFNNVNLKTGNVLTTFVVGSQADIPDTVTGIVLLWMSGGGNCFANDQIAWTDGKVTLGIKNIGSGIATITAVRLLLLGTYN